MQASSLHARVHGVLRKEVSTSCPARISFSYLLSAVNSLDFCGDILWDSNDPSLHEYSVAVIAQEFPGNCGDNSMDE